MLLKLEKILFYIFLFLIPFQIRAAMSWQGNEWNSVFLYLTDLLLIGIFILAARRIYKTNRSYKTYGSYFLLAAFLIIAGLSLFVSSDLGISIYRFIKLLEFVLLYIYIRNSIEFLKIKNIFSVLIASGVVQSILAIGQFLKQGSLGIRFIEAGIYSPGAPGVATFLMGDDKIMRAYGSFPHPNVLAGFLLLSIFALYAKILSSRIGPIGFISLIGLIFSLFLSFSRGPILVFLIISIIFFLARFFQLRGLFHTEERVLAGKKLIVLTGLFLVSCLISIAILHPYLKARFFTISLEEEAIDLRFFYNKMAVAVIKEKPLLGIGIGNFVNYSQNYPAFLRAANKMLNLDELADKEIPNWLYQPVHNIYLLIATEIGILGLLIFLLFIAAHFLLKIKQLISNPLFFLVSCYLILALSDHYFWTLQQGGLIFWLVLGLLSPYSSTDRTQVSGT